VTSLFKKYTSNNSHIRLLKLLIKDYFEPSLFMLSDLIAKGAYGEV